MSSSAEDPIREPALEELAGGGDTTPQRERALLSALERLAAERAASEARIEAQYQAALKSSERAFHDSRVALTTELEIERRDVANDYAEQRRHALARYAYESSAIEKQLADMQDQVAKDFDKRRRRAERKVKEARWEAETLFEASKDLAPRQLKEFEQLIESWRMRVTAERDAADDLLRQWRHRWDESDPSEVPDDGQGEFLTRLQEKVNQVIALGQQLAALRLPPLAASFLPLWLLSGTGLITAAVAMGAGWGPAGAIGALALCVAIGAAASFYLRVVARSQVDAIHPQLVGGTFAALRLADRASEDARAKALAQQAEVVTRRQRSLESADDEYRARVNAMNERRDASLQGPAVEYPKRLEEITGRRDRDLELAEQTRTRREEEIRQKQVQWFDTQEVYRRRVEQIQQRYVTQWQSLADEWQAGMTRVQAAVERIWGDEGNCGRHTVVDLRQLTAGAWTPARDVPSAIRFGQFRVNMHDIPSGQPTNQSLIDLTPAGFALPALLPFPERASFVFKAHGNGRRAAAEAMQAIMLRLLVTIPPGKLRFTIIDPVALGENFAAFMHLADYNEALVTSRIWTDPRHIEQRLADISEHMENVIQKYLRNEFQSIEQYNREAGEIAEPFRYVVVANFPTNFSEAAQRRLLSIAASGARCGVYVILMADTQLPLAPGLSLADFEQHATTLSWRDGEYVWKHEAFAGFKLSLDAPPPPAQVTEILQAAGQYANEAGRVEVPFEVIAPVARDYWTTSARHGLDVPLGRAGATRLQHMKLGHGTSQHVLVAGKTGSGKSTLLHALVTNLALRYSPDEIELYLVDFKQGVEFKTYATHRLPHARVVAIESDREFGVSVLGRLDAELKTRADRFRALGVQDLAGFRQAEPTTALPRILLIVDEFQEFFVEDDKCSQESGLLLDRLVRQGRAFGIHILLGSQTLAGTYTLARSTIGQMAVRIALQCSEADAHLILSEDNSAARLLSRAGEAIYNDSNGLIEGNHPFQIVWLGDERREEYLEQIQALAQKSTIVARPQMVFEGNVPADPGHNPLLTELLEAGRPAALPAAPRAWLGEAVAIKDPTAVTFRRQSGGNLLVVGQNEDAALGMFAAAIVGLSAQHPAAAGASARFYIFDGSPSGSVAGSALAQLPDLTSDSVRIVAWRELPAAVHELAAEVVRRQAAADAAPPPIYVVVYGLQKLRDLRRQEDDFGFSRSDDRPPDPAKEFMTVLRDGPALGVHVLVWCDSVNNLNRTWDRQTLREFELRVAFQMSANDSSTFIDTPAASKLGTHRALFHSEEQELLEKFRPYRWPGAAWLDHVRARLSALPEEPGSGRRQVI